MTHSNDTLNGRLLEWELPEERHLRNRFGYWHMVEERMVRAQMAAEGITPETERGCFYLLMTQRIMENHKDDPKPWHDRHGLMYGGGIRQQAAYELQAMIEAAREECLQALRDIRDGHNDPRGLASAVLIKLDEYRKGKT